MNETEDGQQYVEDMYREVAKSFPGLKEDEIKIEFSPFLGSAAYTSLNETKTKKEPTLIIGILFYNKTKEEQEGIIAHEIGHHEVMKNWTIPRIKRFYKHEIMYRSKTIPASRPHWKQRLRKFHDLSEMAADNKAAETKYGKNLLEVYKKYSFNSETNQVLIKNLEEKIVEAEKI